jgi:hypothetical protein
VSEVDDNGITRQLAERGGDGPQTFTDLESIAAPQTGNNAQAGPFRHRNRLGRERRSGHRPAAQAIGQATIVEAEVEEIGDGAPLHIAVDEHD